MVDPNTFFSSVDEACQLLDQLALVLTDERLALEQQDTEQTHALLQQKTELLTRLDNNAQERCQFLVSQGFEANEAGTQAYFESLPAATRGQYKPHWLALQNKLSDCKSANTVNGKIIHRSRQQIDRLLDVLRGGPDNSKIYTHAGSATSVSSQRPLAKA